MHAPQWSVSPGQHAANPSLPTSSGDAALCVTAVGGATPGTHNTNSGDAFAAELINTVREISYKRTQCWNRSLAMQRSGRTTQRWPGAAQPLLSWAGLQHVCAVVSFLAALLNSLGLRRLHLSRLLCCARPGPRRPLQPHTEPPHMSRPCSGRRHLASAVPGSGTPGALASAAVGGSPLALPHGLRPGWRALWAASNDASVQPA